MYFDFTSTTKIPIDDKKDRSINSSGGGLSGRGLLDDRDLNHQQQNNRNSNPNPFQLPLHPHHPHTLNESKHRRQNGRWRDGRHPLDEGRGWEASDGGGGRGGGSRSKKSRPGEEWGPVRKRCRKNAVMVLKETIPQIEYSVVRATGPCHCPTFTVQTVINGQTYLGCGRTKRKARMQAATRAILSSIQFPDSYVTHDVIEPYLPRSIDFTSDSFHGWFTSDEPEVANPLERSDEITMTSSKVNHRVPDLTEVPWNPVSILNDIRPQSKYRRVLPPGGESNANRKCVRISVTFDGMTFDGVGRCQRSAKQRAAQAALKDHFNLRFIGSVRPPRKSSSSSSKTSVTAYNSEHVSTT